MHKRPVKMVLLKPNNQIKFRHATDKYRILISETNTQLDTF